jgi:biopolymer transport protein ExbD
MIESEEIPPIANINVTPFVDVVLVLLVIFMVTAPLMMKDVINVRLPRAATADGRKLVTLSLAVTKNGSILVNGKIASREELVAEVKQALAKNPDTQAIISADKETFHGDVVKAIDWVKSAGLSRFAIQIERESDVK